MTLQGDLGFGQIALLILVMAMFIFIAYCTITVLIEKSANVRNKLDSFKTPSVVKIVTPIVTSTEKIISKTYRGGRQVVSKVITTVHKGNHVDYFFKKSKKEKELDKKYKSFSDEKHSERMSFMRKHFHKDQ